jgi:hypothetical protein
MFAQTFTIINDKRDRKVSYVCRRGINWKSVFKTAIMVGQVAQLDQLDQENEVLFFDQVDLF